MIITVSVVVDEDDTDDQVSSESEGFIDDFTITILTWIYFCFFFVDCNYAQNQLELSCLLPYKWRKEKQFTIAIFWSWNSSSQVEICICIIRMLQLTIFRFICYSLSVICPKPTFFNSYASFLTILPAIMHIVFSTDQNIMTSKCKVINCATLC